MPSIRLNEIMDAFKAIVDGLEETRHAAAPLLREALDKWAQNVAADAIDLLNEPHWLLSRNITSKVKEYAEGGKIWAMAGFKFSKSEEDKRIPGYYGQFHESGWLPNRRKPTARPRFLRDAKRKHDPTLKEETEKALAGFNEELLQRIRDKRAGNKSASK